MTTVVVGHVLGPILGPVLGLAGGGGPPPTTPGAGPAGVFTLAYDPEAGSSVTLSWQTDVIKAWNGLEQRVSLLAMPRQRYEFRPRLTDAQTRAVLGALSRLGADAPLFTLGLAHEALTVVSSTSSSVTVHSLALCDWAVAGQRVLVVSPAGVVSATAVVQAAAGATIDLDADLSAQATAGARIMPAMSVRLDPDQGFDRYQTSATDWRLAARADRFRFGTAGTAGVGATVATHDGLPVWDWGVGTPGTLAQPLLTGAELVDLGGKLGAIGEASAVDWGRAVSFESHRLADWQWLKAFLHTVKGRARAFLLPTGRPDLPFTGDASGGTLTVVGVGYVLDWYPSLAHRRVRLVFADGTVAYRTITAAADNGDGTQTLSLASAAAGTLARVEFLELVRLDQDEVTITWDGQVASTQLVARVVQR